MIGRKIFIWPSTGNSLYYVSTQPFSTTCEHYYKIISQVNGKFVTYTPYNKLTGFGKVYVGIGSLVGIINLLITPVGNVFTKLGCRGKGTENFSRSDFFQPGKLSSWKPYLCLVTHSYSDKLVLRRIKHFFFINLMHSLCTKL